MSEPSDLFQLYSSRILELSMQIPYQDRLSDPDISANRRVPICGSSITVELKLDHSQKICAYSQDVKACVLGQATAAIVGMVIVGLSYDDVSLGRTQLKAMLEDDAKAPSAPFGELGVLRPAAYFKNRHASIFLVFDAILSAFEENNGL